MARPNPDLRPMLLNFLGIGTATDEEVACFSGDGAPSGGVMPDGQKLGATQRAIYFRRNGAAATIVYVTANGGTAWTALAAAAVSDFGAAGLKADVITESTAGANVEVPDGVGFAVGSGQDAVMESDGTNVKITVPNGDFTIDNTLATGSIVLQLGTDTAATDVLFLNNTGATILAVRGSSVVNSPDDVPHTWGNSDDLSIDHDSGSFRNDIVGANGTNAATAALRIDTGDSTSATGARVTGALAVATGTSTAGGNDGGASGAVTLATGSTDVITAHTGGASGALTIATGATDANNAGATGGATGALVVETGAAASTLGTSGASGNLTIRTGASADGNSGNIALTTGTAAAGTRGGIDLSGTDLTLPDAMPILLGNTGDDSLQHDGTDTIWTHTTGDLVIDSTDVNDPIVLRVGTDTAATGVEFRNNSDAAMWAINPSSASAGTLKGADGSALVLGTGNDDSVSHDGTDTIWTHATGDWIFDSTDVNDPVAFRLGTDTLATAFQIRNNSDAPMWEFLGNGALNAADNAVISVGAGPDVVLTHSSVTSDITLSTGAGAGQLLLHDDVAVFVDPAAPTKVARFDCAGVTAGQTRVVTVGDKNVSLDLIETVITDPGNGNAIPTNQGSGYCALASAGAETRTLAVPTYPGQRLSLMCDAHVGNITLTSAQRINQAGNTQMVFGAVGDFIELVGVTIAAALRWQVVGNDGVALS